jgi:8-oxo-dGTP pyrophosphatase MutT (NUDIX family)
MPAVPRSAQLHEELDRSEVVSAGSDRSFGLTIGAVLALISVFSIVFGSHGWWWLGAAVLFALTGLLVPAALGPLNRLWLRFGLLLHHIVSPVVLALMFYAVMTPIGLLMRLFGKRPLHLKFDENAGSYWIRRDHRTRRTALPADVKLNVNNAVAAILWLEDRRYVMQLRDDKPDIWYPRHWGCFGGGHDDGESDEQALYRELFEELELTPRPAVYFTRVDFDMRELGLGQYFRSYYVVRVDNAELPALRLHEGQKLGAFHGEELWNMPLTPYDGFVLRLFHERHRIGKGWGREGEFA